LPQSFIDRPLQGGGQVPLCVDLDGSLVKSDTMIDTLLVLLRTRPALLLALPGRCVPLQRSGRSL